MQPDSNVHIVEYLTTTPVNTHQGETVVITIRPDPDSFRPHNLALLKPAAERLLADLQKSLARISLVVLLPLLAGGGCSGHVEVSTEKRSPSATTEHVEKFDTQVSLSLLTDGDEPLLPLPSPRSPHLPEAKEEAVKITGDGNVVVAVQGDLHVHEHHHQHMHVGERPSKQRRKPRGKKHAGPVRIEARKPTGDPRCEQLRKEHVQRVREWQKMFQK